MDGTESRRERRARETRERIFREAIALFARKGFESTKIREIAERADVSTVTVHNHFRTKDLLLHALAELYFERVLSLLDEMASLAEREADPTSFVLSARRIVLEWPTTGRQLSADTQRAVIRTATGDRLYREMRTRLLALMTNLQASGVVRRDIPPSALATVVGDLVLGALTSWSTDISDAQTPSDKAMELVGYLVTTLRDPQGDEETVFPSKVT